MVSNHQLDQPTIPPPRNYCDLSIIYPEHSVSFSLPSRSTRGFSPHVCYPSPYTRHSSLKSRLSLQPSAKVAAAQWLSDRREPPRKVLSQGESLSEGVVITINYIHSDGGKPSHIISIALLCALEEVFGVE
eukprot:446532_1